MDNMAIDNGGAVYVDGGTWLMLSLRIVLLWTTRHGVAGRFMKPRSTGEHLKAASLPTTGLLLVVEEPYGVKAYLWLQTLFSTTTRQILKEAGRIFQMGAQ